MPQEQAPQNHNQDPFNHPGDPVAFPIDGEDTLQLAELYSTPGTVIDWQAHPYTTTDPDLAQTGERKAVIETEGHLYYLRDNMLYRFNLGDPNDGFMPFDPDEDPLPFEVPDHVSRQGMYAATVGEDSIFDGTPVTNVLVATETVEADDPRVDDAAGATEDLFGKLDTSVDQLDADAIGRHRLPKPEEEIFVGEPDIALGPWSEVYRVRPNRLGVTDESPGRMGLDARLPLAKSRTGEVMSPQPRVKEIRQGGRPDGRIIGYERDTVEYEPRGSAVVGEGIKTVGGYVTLFTPIKNFFQNRRRNRAFARQADERLAARNKTQAELDAEYERDRQAGKKMKSKF